MGPKVKANTLDKQFFVGDLSVFDQKLSSKLNYSHCIV